MFSVHNTPGTRVGSGFRNSTLTVKSRKISIYHSLSNLVRDWPSFFVYIVDFRSTTNTPGTRVSPRPNVGRKKQKK